MKEDDWKRNKRLSQARALNYGGTPTDSSADLCIYAEEIDNRVVSALVGSEPTEAHRKGDVIGKRRPAPIGLWQLTAPRELSFPDQISYLLKATTSNQANWDKLAATHRIQLRCAVFLHSWNEGFEIPADMIAEMGRRHWEYSFGMYSAEGEEILDAFLKGNEKQQHG